jgi:hypothetical protein
MHGGTRRLVILLVACGIAATAAGCGMGGSETGDPGAPEPRELAWESFRAAQRAGSVHYSFEAEITADGGSPIRLTFDGALAKGRGQADVTFSGTGQSIAGTLLYDREAFYVRFLGKWYGERIPPAQREKLEQELRSEAAFSGRFDEIFDGTVAAGPVADGVSTWAFNGRLDLDGLVELAEEEGEPLSDEERAQLEELVGSARFTLLVGQADMLPRAFRLDVRGEGLDYSGIAGADAGELSVTLSGSFSRWGEPVIITPPSSYAPLDELFGQFFSF